MTTSYKILFMTEMLHDFYKDGTCNDFSFVPSAETKKLLANCKAFCKQAGNKLVVLIKVDDAGKPYILPEPADKFTFFLELNQPLFMTVSGVELNELATRRFYFTNLNQNLLATAGADDVLNLTAPITVHDGAAYSQGDMVTDAGNVYEAIQPSTSKLPSANPDFWMNRNANQYATRNDLIQFITRVQNLPVAPDAAVVNVSLFSRRLANNLFDELVFQQTLNFESAVSSSAIDWTNLPDGAYRLLINGKERMVYLSNDAVYANMFGVIELYNHLLAGNKFAFFDAASLLKDQLNESRNVWLNYTIRFTNRLAFWKYIVPKKGVKNIENNPDFSFNGNAILPAASDIFISTKPIPLRQRPHEFKLRLFTPVSVELPLAPNPDVRAPGILAKNGNDYYCNIHLNY